MPLDWSSTVLVCRASGHANVSISACECQKKSAPRHVSVSISARCFEFVFMTWFGFCLATEVICLSLLTGRLSNLTVMRTLRNAVSFSGERHMTHNPCSEGASVRVCVCVCVCARVCVCSHYGRGLRCSPKYCPLSTLTKPLSLAR